MPLANERLENAQSYKKIPLEVREASNQDLYKKLRSMEISCSQVADQRPISSCSFSPNGSLIATSSWYDLREHFCNDKSILFVLSGADYANFGMCHH